MKANKYLKQVEEFIEKIEDDRFLSERLKNLLSEIATGSYSRHILQNFNTLKILLEKQTSPKVITHSTISNYLNQVLYKNLHRCKKPDPYGSADRVNYILDEIVEPQYDHRDEIMKDLKTGDFNKAKRKYPGYFKETKYRNISDDFQAGENTRQTLIYLLMILGFDLVLLREYVGQPEAGDEINSQQMRRDQEEATQEETSQSETDIPDLEKTNHETSVDEATTDPDQVVEETGLVVSPENTSRKRRMVGITLSIGAGAILLLVLFFIFWPEPELPVVTKESSRPRISSSQFFSKPNPLSGSWTRSAGDLQIRTDTILFEKALILKDTVPLSKMLVKLRIANMSSDKVYIPDAFIVKPAGPYALGGEKAGSISIQGFTPALDVTLDCDRSDPYYQTIESDPDRQLLQPGTEVHSWVELSGSGNCILPFELIIHFHHKGDTYAIPSDRVYKLGLE